MSTPASSLVLVFMSALVGSFGAVFLKLGSERLRYGFRHIVNPQLAFGVALYLLSSVFYAVGIKKGQLSVLYPVISLGYIFTMLWSRVFFREPLTRLKFAAVGLIIAGVFLINLSHG